MLEPLTRETLAVQAARAIKRFILTQQLVPGDQLPSERELTETLGVSRNVVREALQTLVAEGLLLKEPGRGAFIREFDPKLLEEELAAEGQDVTQVRGLLEVRAALEIGALPFIAQRISPTESDQLEQLVAEMRARLEAGQPIVAQDRQFHEALLDATHNPGFAYFKRLIHDAIRVSVMETPAAIRSVRPTDRNSVETAERIVEALRYRDTEEAQRAMRTHLLIDRPPEQARVFLFAEDGGIAERNNLIRQVNPAHKYPHNPLIRPELPWEGQGVLPSATVLYDAECKMYQMWYHGYRYLSPMEEQYSLCYTASVDGIHWNKPALGVVEFDGSTENNLVVPWGNPNRGDVMSATILYTPEDEDGQPYKMIYFGTGVHPLGVCLAFSSDGLHWTPAPENPVDVDGQAPIGDVLYCLHDPETNRVTAYYRIRLRVRPTRTVGRAESHDLYHWVGHQAVLEVDEQDPPDAELYGLTPFRYGELIMGLLWVYRRESETIEIQLACSRDGVTWTRVGNREPFLSGGEPGAFDHQAIVRPTMPIVVGNELWIYYAGQAQPLTGREMPTHQIGLATLTVDRFVSLEAGDDEGYVTTQAISCTDQTQLLLNAVVNRGGYVLTEVLDAEGQPLAGFSRHEAVPFDGNAIYHRVTWRDHDDLSALQGRSLHFRFLMRQAKLYAFRLAQPGAGASDLLAGIC